jgi:polyhydroxybutyrate depolymerase
MRLRPLLLIAGFAMTILAGPCFADGISTMQVGGKPRTYVLVRPSASGPQPTIIVLHGTGADGVKAARTSGLDETGPRQGFVTVFPTAIDRVWNVFPAGEAQSLIAERRSGEGALGDDVAFIKALVADLVHRGISDPQRIYLLGVSYGGFMTLRMTCMGTDVFAGIGIIYSSMPEPASAACHPSKPLPLIVINGTADPVVPYAGGPTPAGFSVWSTDRTLAFFRKLDGCGDSAEQSKLPHRAGPSGTSVVVEHWTQCAGAPIMLYQIVGGGHGVRGDLTGDFDAYGAVATFFHALKTKSQ